VWIKHDATTGEGDAIFGNEKFVDNCGWNAGYAMRYWNGAGPKNNYDLQFIPGRIPC